MFFTSDKNDFQDLDETKLSNKYTTDGGSWGDIPHAGMFKSARESLKASFHTMSENTPKVNRVCTYQNFLRAQSTIHSQSVLVDLMMSERVLNCAQCLHRLENRINEGVRRAFSKLKLPERQLKKLSAYPDTLYLVYLMRVLSYNNKYIRANAVNLTTLWAILVSDVLTHLGSHHETWNWMMYTVQVMGGAGHLRAQTDDHGARTQVNSPATVLILTNVTSSYYNFR